MTIQGPDVRDIDDLCRLTQRYQGNNPKNVWFRGQANITWKLLPKAGRDPYYLPEHGDLNRLFEWTRQAVAYEKISGNNLLEIIAIAQHHGLATRALDWTKYPFAAAYFACCDQESDGAVYAYAPDSKLVIDLTNEELRQASELFCYIPPAISPRIINQGGLLTIHCDAKKELPQDDSPNNLNRPKLYKHRIPQESKQGILNFLNSIGINNAHLFPSLDGLSRDWNIDTEKEVKKHQNRTAALESTNKHREEQR